MRIAVPDLVTNSYFPALAAGELGFLKAEGLDAQVDLIWPAKKAMEALRDGAVDFVAAAAHIVPGAFPEFHGAKLSVALVRGTPWLLVLRSDMKVRRGDLAAVKGLRIGAAPGPDMAFLRMLDEAGIDPARDGVRIGPVPGAEAHGVSFGVAAAAALEQGTIDGFWANATGSETAVRRGVGSVIVDARRGDGPPAAGDYTFAALVATEERIARDPDSVAAAVRGIAKTQQALRADPQRAAEVGRRRFPPDAAGMIADIVARDLPFYGPAITEEMVATMVRFARSLGLLKADVPYEAIVATRFRDLWGV